MEGFNISAAFEVAGKFRNIVRRAESYDYDRDRLIEELIFAAEYYESLALCIEKQMLEIA